jgi:3-oxoacyl-[acyl-carrier protein] reductase
MAGRLEGKVAIVTGGGGSIGTQHCLLLAAEGAKVVVNDIGASLVGVDQASTADRVVALIREAGGEAVADGSSAATWAGAEAVVGHAIDAYGRVDILVNNATSGFNNDIWRFTEEEFDATIAANLKGYFAMTKFVVPHMAALGGGVIVNTSSGSGFGHPSHCVYSAAKEGVIGLTRTSAMELGRFGIRVNAIRPAAASFTALHGYMEKTERWRELMAATMRARGVRTKDDTLDPEVRSPAKISPFVVWLCTDAARNVNGRTFHVLGDYVGLFSEPDGERTIYREGGWTLDALDTAGAALTATLTNDSTLDHLPHLQVFEP